MIRESDREIRGQTLKLDQAEVYSLGPNLTLRECRLVLKVAARNLIITGCRLEECEIEVKRRLSNFRWHRASFSSCRFSGTMSGCDFGEVDYEPGWGRLESADFSRAAMDGCSFYNVDVRSLVLPAWPCFTVLEPRRHGQLILTAPWPRKSRVMAEVLAERPVEVTGVTLHAGVLARHYEVSEDEIRAVVDAIRDATL